MRVNKQTNNPSLGTFEMFTEVYKQTNRKYVPYTVDVSKQTNKQLTIRYMADCLLRSASSCLNVASLFIATLGGADIVVIFSSSWSSSRSGITGMSDDVTTGSG